MNQVLDIHNKYRVLLTEVLPYELPLLMDNQGFYERMQQKKSRELVQNLFSELGIGNGKWTIPFDYTIRRMAGLSSRKLSVMHPCIQLQFADFYEENEAYLLYLCTKSPFSIRHIEKVARCTFSAEELLHEGEASPAERADETELDVELADQGWVKLYRSYFSYQHYDLVSRFFDSGDMLRLEQKYRYLMKMDISKCFYHIYTHSISWAIKGKECAKEYVGQDTFDCSFDKLMQHSNYNETNGIIVGPEISRIFAEVILQHLDLKVLDELGAKAPFKPLVLGTDYEVRRYVDDYYIFAHSKETLSLVQRAFEKHLALFKLYVNESKCQVLERPFVSEISDAKTEFSLLVKEMEQVYLELDDEGQYKHKFNGSWKLFKHFVDRFKSLAYRYHQPYGHLNKFALSLLVKQVKKVASHTAEPFVGLLLAYVEISFYLFSLEMTATASYRLCSILNLVMQCADRTDDHSVRSEVKSLIAREFKRVMDIYLHTPTDADTNLEMLNLLITIDRITQLSLPVDRLCKLFSLDQDNESTWARLNYFQICTLLYLMANFPQYADVKQALMAQVKKRFTGKSALRQSELMLLFLDLMACPFLERKDKNDLLRLAFEWENANTIGKWRKKLSESGRWFFNWDKSADLTSILVKKEYHAPYE